MRLTPKTSLQVQKPIEIVFEALVNPEHMTKYFISESDGTLSSGKELTWKFPEFDDRFAITQVATEAPHSISFVWDPATVVKISLEQLPDGSTLVRVEEDGKELNEDNLQWALQNAAGWANFLACLKAYLEYGIELRKGAFDFMRK